MTNTIIQFLNLKEEEIETINCNATPNELFVDLSLKKKAHTCPTCGHVTQSVLNRYTRKINHGIFLHRKCIVLYTQKRYRCQICQCSFNETCSLVTKGQKKSIASHLMIMEHLKDPHMTFKKTAELLHLSTPTVIDTFIKNVSHQRIPLPEVLCIDEIYLGRKATKKYVSILLDFGTNQVVDVIYGRTKNALHSYFQRIPLEERQRVKYLSSDMYDGFRIIKSSYLKNARVCIDAFHVIQLINTMFNNQLKIIMKRHDYGSDAYYLLKKKRKLLLSNQVRIQWEHRAYNHHFKYTISNHKLREMMFEIDPLIKDLYELKEEYLWINSLRDKELVESKLTEFISKCAHFNHKEVKRVGRTLLKWKAEIINSFTRVNGRRISNGPIESRNNTIKLLIRNAAGYRVFEHLRCRIIYVINSKKKG